MYMYITITELLKENLKDWNENTTKTCDLALIKIFSQEGVRGYLIFLEGPLHIFSYFTFNSEGFFPTHSPFPQKIRECLWSYLACIYSESSNLKK